MYNYINNYVCFIKLLVFILLGERLKEPLPADLFFFVREQQTEGRSLSGLWAFKGQSGSQV